MALHSVKLAAQNGWRHTKRAVGTVSTAAEKATPFHTMYVHPVLDGIPETRHVAKAIHTGLMINKGARGAAAAYDWIRTAIGKYLYT